MKQTDAVIPDLTHALGALSEPVRLRICRLLEQEELSVGEVANAVQLPQSTVSRHLKILAEASWVQKRSEGTAKLYRMSQDDLPESMRPLWVPIRDQLVLDGTASNDDRRLRVVLGERRADSRSFFGRVAGEWDEHRRELFGLHFTAEALLGLMPGDWVVADLGCGTGNAAELLAPHVGSVLAVDASGPMLEAARKRLSGVENVRFVEGELESLPLEDGSVDAAIFVLVLHHLADPGLALREAARITRPGGVVLVVDMVAHDRVTYRHTMGHVHLGFSSEAAASLIRGAGLLSCRVCPLRTDPSARGPGLFVACGRRGDSGSVEGTV